MPLYSRFFPDRQEPNDEPHASAATAKRHPELEGAAVIADAVVSLATSVSISV
jgi:hypothetical protein